MSLEIWLVFVVASSVLLIVPGPTILTVLSYALTHGSRVKTSLLAAVVLGDATALALSLLGLGTLLATSVIWFQVLKWLGGAYLLYLAYRFFRGAALPLELETDLQDPPLRGVFINTYVVTALNPKGIIFFVAFLPQFVNVQAQITPQLWGLAVTFLGLAAINTIFYLFFAEQAKQLIASARSRRIMNLSAGTLLALAAAWTLSARHS